MKFAITVLFAIAIATAIIVHAQAPAAAPVKPSADYYNNILNLRAQQLLASPDFPADLQQRVEQTLTGAQTGFANCSTASYPFVWMQRVCLAKQFAFSQQQLKAIEDEWLARAAASSTAGIDS